VIHIADYAGVDNADPIAMVQPASNHWTGSADFAPQTTPSRGLAIVLVTVDGTDAHNLSAPSGYSQIWLQQSYEYGLAFHGTSLVGPGALPALSVTFAGDSRSYTGWSGQRIVLRAA
jgi:hypothetical protein